MAVSSESSPRTLEVLRHLPTCYQPLQTLSHMLTNHHIHLCSHSTHHSHDGFVCGDFNAHRSSWDDYVSTDPRGTALHDWMKAASISLSNDGSPTRAARYDQCAEISTPDVSLVDLVMDNRFSWKPFQNSA